MPILLLQRRSGDLPPEPETAFTLNESLSGRVGDFLELSQMLTGRVPERELVLDTYVTGSVPGVAASAPAGVLTLSMTAGGLPVESFQYSAERGQGARLDVTVIGDARGSTVPAVAVSAGGQGAAFEAPGTLGEWEAGRDSQGWTTTLHATDRSLIPEAELPELVPWEEKSDKDARKEREKALRVAKIPPAQREAAMRDGRRMPVDGVVQAALATVPHRLLIPAPFPGYDLRADGGPSYSTLGKTPQGVVEDLWGMLGITAGWEGGLLTIRAPGPTGDLLLASPVESERYERITLDAPNLELTGGESADDGSGDGSDDPNDPNNPINSPDPDERGGGASGGFSQGVSPTPQPGEVSANAVPLTWEAVPHASQYILERIEGFADDYTLWSRVAITSATRHTDDTVRPLTTYSYRLRVNATAIAGSQTQNVIWQPSQVALVTTPPVEVDAPPHPVTALEGYYRSSTALGVKWTAPVADPLDADPPRSGPADTYRVDVRDTTPGAALIRRVTTPQTYALIDGLPVGAAVQVSVEAHNAQGYSVPELLNVQLVNLPPAPASAPDVVASGQTLTATWERASGATEYETEYAAAELGVAEGSLVWRPGPRAGTPEAPQDGAAGKPSVIITGLLFDTRYAVRVRGRNEVGSGVWSPLSYGVTESIPAQPEPDPEADQFERTGSSTLTLYRRTDTENETTVLVKSGGRIESMTVDSWAKVPLYAREKGPDGEKVVMSTSWKHTKATTTRYFYEVPGWPLTLTGRVEETVLFGTEAILGVDNPEIGREQEKIHQEWSPQGWLNRRHTERSKAAVMKIQRNDQGETISREYGNQHEFVYEQWQPIGQGLWFYQRSGVLTSMLPTLADGEYEDLVPAFKATPSESSVSEQAPEQAVLPKDKQEQARQSGPPALPRNSGSPALGRYPLDEPWFGSPGGGGGPPGGQGGEPEAGPPSPPPSGPYDPPKSPPNGSGDPDGQPASDLPPKDNPPKITVTYGVAAPGATPNSPVLTATIPWVRTAQGLARYAALMAQVGGPRTRITRTYILPVTPPSLDAVSSINASGSGSDNQFSMTVTTETR